jgi:hypothetical protein
MWDGLVPHRSPKRRARLLAPAKSTAGSGQHRADLRRGPPAAAGGAHAAGVQDRRYAAQAGHAALLHLADNGRDVLGEAARGLGGARGPLPVSTSVNASAKATN